MIEVDTALLASTLRQATPIALATLGITLSEKAGVVHLAAEGVMLSSAFAAVAATFYSGSPWIGLLAGVATGGLIGVVMGVLSVYTESNQVVVGFGINLVAIGITPVLLERVWGNTGRSDAVAPLPAVHLPGLRALPVLGPAIDSQAVTFYILLALIGASWLMINRSVGGLRIRAVGEHALAAAAAGVRVRRLRLVTVIVSCAVCGLGGVAVSLAELGLFGRNMTGARLSGRRRERPWRLDRSRRSGNEPPLWCHRSGTASVAGRGHTEPDRSDAAICHHPARRRLRPEQAAAGVAWHLF